MEPKLIWGNLASVDLERTTQFYSALGFTLFARTEEMTSFSFSQHKFVINFFPTASMEKFTKSKSMNLKHQNEVIFSISAESKEEVDQWYEKVKQAGGTIYAEPEPYQEGYTFGFADPDGHKFNFLYWPGM